MGKVQVGETVNVFCWRCVGGVHKSWAWMSVEVDAASVAWINKWEMGTNEANSKRIYEHTNTQKRKKNQRKYCLHWEVKIYKTKADIKEEIVYLPLYNPFGRNIHRYTSVIWLVPATLMLEMSLVRN